MKMAMVMEIAGHARININLSKQKQYNHKI
jgi:hypothetical protein